MNPRAKHTLVTLRVAADLIRSGAYLAVAGPEALLARLPRGNWIGGTSSYFTAADGGMKSTAHLFITLMPEAAGVEIDYYPTEILEHMMQDAPDNGFSFTIIPHGGESLRRFSEEGRYWPGFVVKPVVGWVAGIDLDAAHCSTPAIYDGRDGSRHDDGMMVMHVTLPKDRVASMETVNIFDRDTSAGIVRFDRTGFEMTECTVDGIRRRLWDFFKNSGNADGRLPLVGDFLGANINVSVQRICPETGKVRFYAPVFPDVDYYLALPVGDYQARLATELERRVDRDVIFSCNCILNYLYGDLQGKRTGSMQGPVTFGEIAYLLHNQTVVSLMVS